MAQVIEAIYERGMFKPIHPVELSEGQRVKLSVEPLAMSTAEAKAYVQGWARVYEGLSEEDIAEIEAIALDRKRCSRRRDEDEAGS